MNHFVPRTEPVTSVGSVRPISAITAVKTDMGGEDSGPAVARQSVAGVPEPPTATANYARIQADIAQALKAVQDRQPSPSTDDLGNAERAMLDLMPKPIVVLPMPPTDSDMVEFVAQVAQALAQQAMLTQAAQARIAASTIDSLVA